MISHIRRRTIFAGPFDIVELCLVSETLSCHCAEHTSCCLAIWGVPEKFLAVVVHHSQLFCYGSVVLVELIQDRLQRCARILFERRFFHRISEVPPRDLALKGNTILKESINVIDEHIERPSPEAIHDSGTYHIGPPQA